MSKGPRSAVLPVLALFAGLGLFIYLEYREYVKEEKVDTVPVELKRNVYLITATGLRPDHLSSYLYQSIQTPALDYLAYDGIRFTDAWTTSPESLPAHLSMLSGIYPFRVPVSPLLERYCSRTSSRSLRTGFTLPEWFRRRGYLTAAFLSDPDLRIPELMNGLFQTVAMGDRPHYSWEPSYTTDQACRRALQWIENNRSRPHVVLLNLDEPTPPYRPPSPFDLHYKSYPYDGEIAALDEQIGLLVNRLKSEGLFDRSIIVFAAPNADGPGDISYDQPLRNERLQIPLFIVAPGLLPRHRTYLSPVSLVDVFPTVLALLSMDPAGLNPDGLSLFEKGSDREIRRDYLFGGSFFGTVAGVPPVYFMRSPGWKLITGEPDLMFSPTSDYSPSNTDVSRKMAAEMKPRLLALQPAFAPMKPSGDQVHAVQAGQAIEMARAGNVEQAYQMLQSDPAPPDTPALLALRSELAETTGRLEEALNLSQRAYRAAAQPEFLVLAARQRVRALQYPEADGLMSRYGKRVSTLSYYDHHIIGTIREGLGDFPGAVREFGLALADNPRFLDSLVERSHCLERTGDLAHALSDLRAAAELDPGNADINSQLASLILKSGAPQDAAPYLRRVLESRPSDPVAMLKLARLHESSGNSAEAGRLAREIIIHSKDPVLTAEAKKIIARQ